MAAAEGLDSALDLSDERPCFRDLRESGAGRCRRNFENEERGGLRSVWTAEPGHDVLEVLIDVADQNAFGVAQRIWQVPGIDLLDLDGAIVLRLVGIPGTGISERVVLVPVAGGQRRPKVSILKHAHVGDEQLARILRHRHCIRIPAGLHAAHDGREVIRLEHLPRFVHAGRGLRDVQDKHVETALVDHIEVSAVWSDHQVAGERALEAAQASLRSRSAERGSGARRR